MRLALALAACSLLAGCYYPYPYPASTTASPSSQPVVWSNPEAGTSGTAAAQPAGETCREYQTSITLDGRPQPAWGVVCRQPDGSWRLVR
jgi:surface antigen